MTLFKKTAIYILGLTMISCHKEENWSTDITPGTSISFNSVNIDVAFDLEKNNDFLYCGVCQSETTNPTLETSIYEAQYKESETHNMTINDLHSSHSYHFRSYIKLKTGDVLYSDDFLVETPDLPEPSCLPVAGKINFSGDMFDMGNLAENTSGDDYVLHTSCAYGSLDFTFADEPQSGLYATVSSASWLTDLEVYIAGTLGIGFSCYYGGSSANGIYVNNDSGQISIAFCDLQMSTSQSCSDLSLQGEVHE
ncbi:MAG: hypothetical protein HYZ14_15245 [Bacteroidetes bacterium]|nr:hypothetical protein [Bacteroidota bacterium]